MTIFELQVKQVYSECSRLTLTLNFKKAWAASWDQYVVYFQIIPLSSTQFFVLFVYKIDFLGVSFICCRG